VGVGPADANRNQHGALLALRAVPYLMPRIAHLATNNAHATARTLAAPSPKSNPCPVHGRHRCRANDKRSVDGRAIVRCCLCIMLALCADGRVFFDCR
jgi:hypothetical protein